MGLYNFISLLGIVILILVGYFLSTNRKEINWHVVVWGIGLQMLIALFLFIFPVGVKVFIWVNDIIVRIMDSSLYGAKFVFGRLAIPPGDPKEAISSLGFILAFQAFPTIIFFSALMSMLYYFSIMPRIIKAFAYLFTKLMKVSGAESLCTAANIFVGVESVLTVKPFLPKMTPSEMCTVLTAGMATISSSMLAIYVFSLQDIFPNIAGHLVSASFLSAPAALMMSKIILPEEGKPETLGEHVEPYIERDQSLFESIIKGANSGVQLIIGIVALLIAVLGLVACFDQLAGFLGKNINAIFHLNFEWSLKNILGIIFYPFTLILGVPMSDVAVLSRIIGERVVVTELTSYRDLALAVSQGEITSMRSAVVATYALCGFAHIASLAIFVGGISAIVPEKTSTLAKVGFRSLLAATLACLMTACIAGVFFTENSILLG